VIWLYLWFSCCFVLGVLFVILWLVGFRLVVCVLLFVWWFVLCWCLLNVVGLELGFCCSF